MEVNDALEKLGGVGRWQILHYTTLCVASSFTPCFHLFSILYIGKHTSLYTCCCCCADFSYAITRRRSQAVASI